MFGLSPRIWQLVSDVVNNIMPNMIHLENTRRTKNTCSGNPLKNLYTYDITSNGAIKNYINISNPCGNNNTITNVNQVILPYGIITKATHKVELDLNPIRTPKARKAHIYPHLHPGYLIYIGKLCDDGCTKILTSTKKTVAKKGITVIEGNHWVTSGMCQVNINNRPW